jgi:hypothetical protein
MLLFNKVSLNSDDHRKIRSLYRTSKDHYQRQKALLLILRSEGFSLSKLVIIFNRNKQYIKQVIKDWDDFGYDCFKNRRRKIVDEKPAEAPMQNLSTSRNFDIFEKILNKTIFHIKFLFTNIINAIVSFWSILFELILNVFSWFKVIDIKKFSLGKSQKILNRIEFAKGSSGNNIFQFFYNSQVGENPNILKEEKNAPLTISDTKEEWYKILNSGKEFVSSNLVVALTFAITEKVQKVKSEEFRKRLLYLLAAFITYYFVFHVVIKTGLVLIPILGVAITIINFRGCLREPYNHNSKLSNSFDKKTIIESVPKQKLNEPVVPIFLPVENCTYLSKLDKNYINQDATKYYDNAYVVQIPDQRFYVHVAVYRDIKEAVFQRIFLIKMGFPNSMILEIFKGRESFYYVTIDDFDSENILPIFTLKQLWDTACNKSDSKLQIFYNN